MNYPKSRLRRLRYNKNIRSLVQDVQLNISDLIYPIFICEGENIKEEIKSLPGQYRLSVDNVLVLCDELIKLGIKSILLFGISDKKDNDGSIACSEDSIIPFAIKKIKKKFSTDILIMADLCNCSYTSHGHCGTIENNDVSSTKQSANIFRIGYGVPYEEGFNLTVTKGARNNFREQQNTFTFFVPMDLLYLTQKHTPSFLVKDANINLHDLIPFYSKNDFNGDGINVYSFLRAEPVINASVLYNLGWYTIRELKEAGYQIRIRLR